jgi:hypothetical protein
MTDSACFILCINCIFRAYCFINSVIVRIFSFIVFLILVMYFRYFDAVNNYYIASLLNKHHKQQDKRLPLSYYRVFEGLLPQ